MSEIVIIPAAGLATRLRPISNSMSKAMVAVAGKPILARILTSLRTVADKIVVVYGQNEDIPQYIESLGQNIIAVKQTVADGPLGAIDVGRQALGFYEFSSQDSVTVWLGDTLVSDENEIVEFFLKNRSNGEIKLATADVADYSRWCMIDGSQDPVVYYDKPNTKPPTTSALIGLYRFKNAKIFNEKMKSVMESIADQDQKEIMSLLSAYDIVDTQKFVSWLDCGDLPSLHAANAALINSKSREHNHVKIVGPVVNKKLSNDNECAWYERIQTNNRIKPIIPQYLGREADGSFNIELCSGNTLQDMLVYDNIRTDCWGFIIKTVLGEYTARVGTVEIESKFDPHHMFHWNIAKRLNSIGILSGNIRYFLDESFKMLVSSNPTESAVIHGDFHFGNIIYDATCNKVKLIDPRGEWCGVQTTAGNPIYDFAKFYQSFYAKYAWTVSGEPVNEVLRTEIIKIADAVIGNPRLVSVIKRYAVLLQMSAVPLHYDNPERQKRMLDTSISLIKTDFT